MHLVERSNLLLKLLHLVSKVPKIRVFWLYTRVVVFLLYNVDSRIFVGLQIHVKIRQDA